MTSPAPDESDAPVDPALLDRLIAYDEAHQQGHPLELDASASPQEEQRWRRARTVLDLLHECQAVLEGTQEANLRASIVPVRNQVEETQVTPQLKGAVNAEQLEPPHQLGRYRIERELGFGGMSVVYLAHDPELKRAVAIKVLQSGEPNGLLRFYREAELLAALQHPNIVQVFERGRTANRPFLVMEYVDGASLKELLRAETLPPREACRLLALVARAVQAAHERGIIHRDLKPANILLTASGIPKVSDFGLARVLDEDSGLTQTSQTLGTPSYIAPEQVDKTIGAADARTDVYGLGAVLYQMLTGRPPFTGLLGFDVLNQVANDDPVPVRRLNPSAPRDLETVCLKCLEKQPRCRYPTALAVAEELERFLNNRPVQARPVSFIGRLARWRRRNPLVAVLAAILLVVVIGTCVALAALAGIAVQERNQARLAAQIAKISRDEARAAEKVARRERANALAAQQEASRQADIARAVSEFLQHDLLLQADPRIQEFRKEKPDPNLTVRQAMDRASARIGSRFADQPAVEAAVQQSIGQAYLGLGDPKAILHLNRAVALCDQLHDRNDYRRRAVLVLLGKAYHQHSRIGEGLIVYEEVLRLDRCELGPFHETTLESLRVVALMSVYVRPRDKALAMLKDVLQQAGEQQAGRARLLAVRCTIASILSGFGERAAAMVEVAHVVDALAAERDTLLRQLSFKEKLYLGNVLLRHDQAPLGGMISDEAIQELRVQFGKDHLQTLHGLQSVIAAHTQIGDFGPGIRLWPELLDGWRRKLGVDHPTTLDGYGNCITTMLLAAEWRRAESVSRDFLDIIRAQHPSDETRLVDTLNALAWSLLKQGKLMDAATPLEECNRLLAGRAKESFAHFVTRGLLGEAKSAGAVKDDAEELLVSSFHGMFRRQTEVPTLQRRWHLRTGADRLIAYYEAVGQASKAAEWRQRRDLFLQTK